MTMADVSRYARGARDPQACAAAILANKKRRVRVAREGELTEPAGPTRHRLRMLHKRMSWHRMQTLLPLTDKGLAYIANGQARRVRRTTADAVEALWADYCADVEKDKRRWPIQPFKEAVVARYGTVKALGNTNQVRQIWRGETISTKQAEDYAASLDLLPVEIWTDWYDAA